MDYYIHHIKGRIRLKTPVLKNNIDNKQIILNLFESLYGIIGISVNTLTGSVVIHYEPDIFTREDIIGMLKAYRFLDDFHIISNDNRMERFIESIRKEIRKTLFALALETVLEPIGLSFVCVLL
jgi:hypothetical protein